MLLSSTINGWYSCASGLGVLWLNPRFPVNSELIRARGKGTFAMGGVGVGVLSFLRGEELGLGMRRLGGNEVGDSPLLRELDVETCRLDICEARRERIVPLPCSAGCPNGLLSPMSRALSLSYADSSSKIASMSASEPAIKPSNQVNRLRFRGSVSNTFSAAEVTVS